MFTRVDVMVCCRAYTLKVVQQAHDDWARLWMGVTDKGKFVV